MLPYDLVISLGYRCSSAGILKSLGLKTESHPFDWMVSRLPIIEHCIATDFRYFLDDSQYDCKTGVTNNYTSPNPSSRQWICNESFCFNSYYESDADADAEKRTNLELYLPKHISPVRDAYGYKMMMNHHNIKTKQTDRDYFARCVERWNRIGDKKTLSLYIHPAVFYEEFLEIRSSLLKELRRFHNSISTTLRNNEGIYIIPVKTPFNDPTKHCAKYVLEEQPDDEGAKGCRICILWANSEFIDAGEIFMGNSHVETYVIQDYLQVTVKNRSLMPIP